MATRKMEVSDAMILLAVDGSSLFLAHKADLQMRSQAVLRVPRKTDILWNDEHSLSSVDLKALELQAVLNYIVFPGCCSLSSLRILCPREAWNLREGPVGKSRSPLTSKLAARGKEPRQG